MAENERKEENNKISHQKKAIKEKIKINKKTEKQCIK